jgi:hypothetical protein
MCAGAPPTFTDAGKHRYRRNEQSPLDWIAVPAEGARPYS